MAVKTSVMSGVVGLTCITNPSIYIYIGNTSMSRIYPHPYCKVSKAEEYTCIAVISTGLYSVNV